MDYKDYAEKVLRYQEIDNYQFPEDAAKDEVISQLRQFSAEKKEIQGICNSIIREHIEKYENDPELLDEAAVEKLNDFANQLYMPDVVGGDLDTGITYRIYQLLYDYYDKKNMLEEAVAAVTKLASCESEFNSHLPCNAFSKYSEKSEQYVEYFDQLSLEGKQTLLRCYLGNLKQECSVSELVARYKAKRTFWEQTKNSLPEEFNKGLEVMFTLNAAGAISTKKSMEDDAIKAGKKTLQEYTDLSKDEDLKKLLNDLKNVITAMGGKQQKTKIYYLQFAYQVGEITLEEMLRQVKELAQVNPEDDIRTQWGALFLMNAFYMTCLHVYSPKSEEEVKKESEEIANMVLDRAQEMATKETNRMLNYYLMMFIVGASYVADDAIFKKIVLNSTVYANKALYVHTMMVKEISVVLLDYILKYDAEYLDGVAGYDISYIKEHPQEIMEIMEDCALLHDVGKYPCLDYTSLSFRRLTEEEFAVIKYHPENYEAIYSGAATLTGECVMDCALLHHRWYNGKGGYPEREHTKNKPFIGILSIADSIDAALDSIGRPYGEGKTLDDLIAEFETMRDTRYSSRVIDALIQPEVIEKVEYILRVRQEEINYEVYQRVK